MKGMDKDNAAPPGGGGRGEGRRRAGHAPERRGGSGEREQRGVGNRGGRRRGRRTRHHAHGDRRRTRNLRHHRARRRGTHGTRSDRRRRAGADPNAARGRSSLAAQGLVLAVLLAVSLVVHFPAFCLFCPIGLAFGTLFAASRMFVTWQPGWELIAFPAMLLAEVFLLRRWCAAICPLGFFFRVMAKLHVRLPFLPRPRARAGRCLYGEGCRTCATVCPEDLCVATATPRDLEDCTGCLDCTEHCPTKAVTLSKPKEK